MSEAINERNRNKSFRHDLLTHASMLALLGYLGASAGAQAASTDEDRPIIWIELGGQFERMDNTQTMFVPPFVALAPQADQNVMLDAQKPSPYSIGGEAKITFAPETTNWLFSAAIRYGRSNSARHLHHETAIPLETIYVQTSNHIPFNPPDSIFGDGQSSSGASHYVLDFQAGKDVGLGVFGAGGSSVISAGVRFAQFTSHSNITLHAAPTYAAEEFGSPGKYKLYHHQHHSNIAVSHAARNTHAIGPSASWDASLAIASNDAGMTLAFDWGVNAAMLFGRQRVHIHHQTTGEFLTGIISNHLVSSYARHPADPARSRSVLIPNAGGLAGVSLKFPDAKVSVGYRADFFFGAMDGGIDTAKKENIGFYGPFASISIGFGG